MKKKNTSYQKALLGLFVVLIVLLVFNVGYLALTGIHFLSGGNIREHAKDHRSETTEIVKAQRGNIYSYDGDLLVTDRASYIVVAYIDDTRPGYEGIPSYVDKKEQAAAILSKYVDESYDRIMEIFNSGLYQYEFKAYLTNTQKEALEKELANDANFVETEGMTKAQKEDALEKLKIHGIEFIKTASRTYAYNHFCSYLLGFINVNDDDSYHIERYGVQGVEAAYNDLLDGTDGQKVYQADTQGYAIYNARISETDSVNGCDIYLSLDSEIQNMLEVQLDNAMVETHADSMWFGIMDAKTGRIIAECSRPDYDLQDRNSITRYSDLFFDELYEVGSVVKPFVYLAAMEAGKYDGSETYQSGIAYVDDSPGLEPIQDYNYGVGWGVIPYDEGLIHSSNTAIVHLVQDKGIINDVIATYEKIGFFQSKVIDDIQSKLGMEASEYQITTAEGWYQYKYTEAPYDKVTMCFGQSSNYTPFDLLRAYTIFANEGRIMEPYLIDHVIDSSGQTIYSATPQQSEQLFNKDNIEYIKDLLVEVVNNDELGTGTVYKSDDFTIFGKTGTGDLFDENGRNIYKSYYSFAGGAPAEDPQVVFFIGCQGYKEYLPQEAMNKVVQSIVSQTLAKLNTNVITSNEAVVYQDTVVPSLINQSVEFAKKQLGMANLSYELIGQGDVIKAQYPESEADISSAKKIFLLTDDTTYTLPDFTGWSKQDIATYFHFFDINVHFYGNGVCGSQSIVAGTDVSTISDISIDLK